MKITLAQIHSVAGDVEGNVAKIIEAAHKAKASTLVIFPELSVSGVCSAEMFKSQRQGVCGAQAGRVQAVLQR